MSNWTELEYLNHMKRAERDFIAEKQDEADPGPESHLATKIRKYCKERGFPCF